MLLEHAPAAMTRKCAGATLIACALLGVSLGMLDIHSADADPLPFLAYGVGLRAGQVVEAFDGSVAVGSAIVDARGNWSISISANLASEGDRITFALDGKVTREGLTFQSGQFTPGGGLRLTVPGTFNTPPVFSGSGISQVVFSGSVKQLQDAVTGTGATSAWAQDAGGTFVALIPGAPIFVNAGFNGTFAAGFAAPTTVTLVR